ncbi:MAG: D-isomer specific 2-hydroxyacid dehydrogenase NAD-binding subunit [Hyphomicrobiales bacterium]|nr:D-isomer specific 2-hydroxyacid dehydrogenase NAD-binding subunit [Hyphomicrobiales bacterium]
MQRPLDIVVLLNSPEETQRAYREGLPAAGGDLRVHVVNDVGDIDPLLPSMEALMTYGSFLCGRGPEIFAAAPRLGWVQALGSGVDNLLPERADVAVSCVRGIHAGAVSEAVFAALLALSRDMPRTWRNQRAHTWERRPSSLLEGKRIGLLGVGLIAEALAPRCKAFGMHVVGFTSRQDAIAGVDEIRTREDLAAKVGDLDALVALTPLTPQTRHLVSPQVLAAMKPSAFLVNVARGGIVDEAALLDALRRGALAGAALDVFAAEPLPAGHPFWDMDNVIVTPHVAGMNREYVAQAMPTLLHNIRAYRAGAFEDMISLVRAPASASNASSS